MQKIMEPAFEILYLVGGLVLSILILAKARGAKAFVLFGVMGLTLVFGDAFHLVPRILNSWELGGDNIVAALGIGKLITSVTMTAFYLILFHFFKLHWGKHTPLWLDVTLYALAAVRVVLCALPYNQWTSADPSYLWGIYRNIPFVLMGGVMVAIAFCWAREAHDKQFGLCWLAITLSFAFYMMTVLLTRVNSLWGMMMIPKTVCYVWVLVMGLSAERKENAGRTAPPENVG